MRMRRNWSKRLTALMLAILAFAALGTVALADETDPEKDLVIGSEYGGGGSPGTDFNVPAEGKNRESFEDDWYVVGPGDPVYEAIIEREDKKFGPDGVDLGESASGHVIVYYGVNEAYYDDGSYGVDVAFQNVSGKNLTMDLTLVPVNKNGVLLDVLDTGSYNDGFQFSAQKEYGFRLIFSERYANVQCSVNFKDEDGESYGPLEFKILPGNSNVRTLSIVNMHSADDPIWSTGQTSIDGECETCGIVSDDAQEHDDVNIGLWIMVIGILLAVICVVIFIIREKKKKELRMHENKS